MIRTSPLTLVAALAFSTTGISLAADLSVDNLYASQRVGIGVGSTPVKLFVYDGSSASSSGTEVVRIASAYSGSVVGSGGSINFTDTSSTALGKISSVLESNNNVGMAFSTFGFFTLGEKMRISSTGDIGIGTTTPAAKLHVVNWDTNITSAGKETLRLQSYYDGAVAGSGNYINFTDYSGTALGQVRSTLESNGNIGVSISTYNWGLSEKFRVSSTGNVGIGTATPQAKLEVNGNALIGTGLGVAYADQTVIGRYNDTRTADGTTNHMDGLLIVGNGTNTSNRQNAVRVTGSGNTLIRPAGDISMGIYTAGPQP